MTHRAFFHFLFLLLLALPLTLSAHYFHAALVVSPKGRKATMHAYHFDEKLVRLKVIPRGENRNLGAAMKRFHCLAGCNGGFFDPQYQPLGEEISDGKKRGQRNLASSLTSGVFYQSGDRLILERAKIFYKENRKSSLSSFCKQAPSWWKKANQSPASRNESLLAAPFWRPMSTASGSLPTPQPPLWRNLRNH